ncbi:MAG: hypothetical protein E7Z90_06915 [Cyanobacteria bacterium SIG29]|nr:hypothetical protein [Cyanobacteria bacterium SIG29]
MSLADSSKFHSYLGAIHIHSDFSDGSGDIQVISKAAKKAGLDFVIVTDHNNFDIQEGLINGVYVIKGLEISPDKSNHYLALGINELVSEKQSPKQFVEEVRNQGGFGFSAHPDESDKRKNIYPPIKWLDKSVIPDGVEIWNWFSNWGDNFVDKNIFTQAYAFLFRNKLITKPKNVTLQWWDSLNEMFEKVVPAIGGIDAHALKINKFCFTFSIFPYESMFKTINNLVFLKGELSDDFYIAKEQILNALKNGNNIILNRTLSKLLPDINVSNLNKIVTFGEEITFDENVFVNIKLGKKFEIRVLCDGKVVWQNKVKEAKIPLSQKGKYRVEVILNNVGYLYSNPVVVV